MTNLQKAAEQDSQAAPNILEAIKAGEVGGGGSATGFTIQYYAELRHISDNEKNVYTEEEALIAAQNTVAKWQEDYPNLNSLRFAALFEYPKVAEPHDYDDYIYYYYVTQSAIDTWLEKVDWLYANAASFDSDGALSPELIAEAKEIVAGLTPNTLFQADEEIVEVVINFGSIGKIGYQPWPLYADENTLAQTVVF
jgi:hypothetical protein